MEKITRTVTATTIKFSEAVVEDGAPAFKSYPDEIIADTVDKEKALTYLRKKFGADRSFLITDIQTSTRKYEMDLSAFVRAATPVGEKEATAEEKAPAHPAEEPVCEPAVVEPAAPTAEGENVHAILTEPEGPAENSDLPAVEV